MLRITHGSPARYLYARTKLHGDGGCYLYVSYAFSMFSSPSARPWRVGVEAGAGGLLRGWTRYDVATTKTMQLGSQLSALEAQGTGRQSPVMQLPRPRDVCARPGCRCWGRIAQLWLACGPSARSRWLCQPLITSTHSQLAHHHTPPTQLPATFVPSLNCPLLAGTRLCNLFSSPRHGPWLLSAARERRRAPVTVSRYVASELGYKL